MVDVDDVAVMALGHAYDFHALYIYMGSELDDPDQSSITLL